MVCHPQQHHDVLFLPWGGSLSRKHLPKAWVVAHRARKTAAIFMMMWSVLWVVQGGW